MTRTGSRTTGEPSSFEYARVDLSFRSAGTRCTAWLYRPDRPADPRLVVTAPGIVPDRRAVAPVARRYAERGYAVLLFSPRHAAESDGDPPFLLDPRRQAADWAAALDAASEVDGVAARRPVLRGCGLAGALALAAACARHVGPVVARSPLVSGPSLRRPPRTLARLLAAVLRDRLPGTGATIPVASAADPETGRLPPALYHGEDVVAAVDRLSPRGSRTEIPARSALALSRLRLPDLAAVSAPALLTTADADRLVSAAAVSAATDAIPDATYLETPGDGLAGLGDPARDAALSHEFAFLADQG